MSIAYSKFFYLYFIKFIYLVKTNINEIQRSFCVGSTDKYS